MGYTFDDTVRDTILFLLRATKTPNNLFASETGLSPGTISNYLRGRRTPTAQALCKIADFFDMSLDELCGRREITKDRLSDIQAYREKVAPGTERIEYRVAELTNKQRDEFEKMMSPAVKGEDDG